MLLKALSYRDEAIVFPTLEAMSLLAMEAPVFLSEHIDSLVQILLDLSSPQGQRHASAPSVYYSARSRSVLLINGFLQKVRLAALHCLAALVGLPYNRLHPLRPLVLRRLLAALDDPKRVVRKQAVICRARWAGISGSLD